VEKFFGRTPNTSVPPEEAVARGAAVQAAMLAGETTGLILADVVPLTLGVRTKGGLMHQLIKRNTPVPVEVTQDFSTTENNQESIEVQVYQGEHPLVEQNVPLASFVLAGIELAPAGQPHIKITFKVDPDGILHVTGQDMYTGQFKQITVTNSIRLSEEDIEKMVCEAEAHAEVYEARRIKVEQQLQAASLQEKLNLLLAEHEATWPNELVTAIQTLPDVTEVVDLATHIPRLEELLYKTQHVHGKETQG
jgi:molecular chaperone DnaK